LRGFVRLGLFALFVLPARLCCGPWRTTKSVLGASAWCTRIGQTSKKRRRLVACRSWSPGRCAAAVSPDWRSRWRRQQLFDLVAPVAHVQQLADTPQHLDIGRGIPAMSAAGRWRRLRRRTEVVLELGAPHAQGRWRHGQLGADFPGAEHRRTARGASMAKTRCAAG